MSMNKNCKKRDIKIKYICFFIITENNHNNNYNNSIFISSNFDCLIFSKIYIEKLIFITD